mmetsp:Transcript_113111/g.365402  ORF Transcript_113111/g.365402 Transcript_113111/m.365402 type:complete len:304 (-) Transcript_113111:395-1306(-)
MPKLPAPLTSSSCPSAAGTECFWGRSRQVPSRPRHNAACADALAWQPAASHPWHSPRTPMQHLCVDAQAPPAQSRAPEPLWSPRQHHLACPRPPCAWHSAHAESGSQWCSHGLPQLPAPASGAGFLQIQNPACGAKPRQALAAKAQDPGASAAPCSKPARPLHAVTPGSRAVHPRGAPGSAGPSPACAPPRAPQPLQCAAWPLPVAVAPHGARLPSPHGGCARLGPCAPARARAGRRWPASPPLSAAPPRAQSAGLRASSRVPVPAPRPRGALSARAPRHHARRAAPACVPLPRGPSGPGTGS